MAAMPYKRQHKSDPRSRGPYVLDKLRMIGLSTTEESAIVNVHKRGG